MAVTCYLAVGSNLGDRRQNIKLAIEKINKLRQTKVLKVSKLSQTNPVGGPAGQNKFLNGALKIQTRLRPQALLKNLRKIEQDLGRKRTARFGPRSIDLDILLYADKIIKSKSLVIPHPRMFEREFVLKPLAEVI